MIKHSLFSYIDKDIIIKMQNNKWTIHNKTKKPRYLFTKLKKPRLPSLELEGYVSWSLLTTQPNLILTSGYQYYTK